MLKSFIFLLGLVFSATINLLSQSYIISGNTFGVPILSGACTSADTCFTLTPEIQHQQGSVFSPDPINLNYYFDGNFCLNFGTRDGNGADGFAFVLKDTNSPNLGISGGGLGYETIPNSVAIEFDTWHNGSPYNDLTSDHTALSFNGNPYSHIVNPISLNLSGNVEDGNIHFARIIWDPADSSLSLYFDGVFKFSHSYDYIDSIFGGDTLVDWGFTASTGGSYNLQQICFPKIKIELGNDIIMCEGDTALICYNKPGLTRYLWTNTSGDTLKYWNATFGSTLTDTCVMTNKEDTLYLEVTFNNKTEIDSIHIFIEKYPTAYIDQDTLFYCGDIGPAIINVSDTVNTSNYIWTPLNANSYQVASANSGYNKVQVFNAQNICPIEDSVYLIEYCTPLLVLPNVFSPDSDNMNDFFKPLIMYWVGDHDYTIYNRWGNEVYKGKNDGIKWDGKNLDGKLLSPGTYYYLVNYKDVLGVVQPILKGFVTLFRD